MKKAPSDVAGWLAVPVIALVLFAVPLPEQTIEDFYSRGFYRGVQRGVTSLSNLAPFALLDLFILGAVVLMVWRAARLWGVAREAGIVAAAWEGLRRLMRGVAVLGLVFLLLWGLNSRRVPLDQTVP